MEPTLGLSYVDYCSRIGVFAGWGQGAVLPYTDPAWSSQQQGAIDASVKSGLNAFYYPEPLEGEGASYNWSFMRPVATLAVAVNAVTVPLPDDFGGVEGQMTLAVPTGIQWLPIDFTDIGRVYQMQTQYPTTTGRPQMACVEPIKGTGPVAGQRFQIRLWPIADMAYSLQFQYYVNPDYINGAFPYALGGAQHTDTILSSCKAAFERDFDDILDGPQQINFKRRLAASVNMDRRLKPQKPGYNRDLSDMRGRDWNWRAWGENGITVRGIQY